MSISKETNDLIDELLTYSKELYGKFDEGELDRRLDEAGCVSGKGAQTPDNGYRLEVKQTTEESKENE